MDEPTTQQRDSESKDAPGHVTNARWSAIGIQIGVSVGLGALGGMWLDDKLDTDPWFVLAGILLGLFAVFIDIYRLMKKTQGGT
jgi:F0F1-type ATP synthase assembly protein I